MSAPPRKLWRVLAVVLGVVALGAGLISVLGGVDSKGTPSVNCGTPAVVVALGGGKHPEGRGGDCRGAGGDQALGSAIFLLAGVVLVFGPRIRRWSNDRTARELRREIDNGRWRISPPWRQLAAGSVVLAVGGFLIAALFDPTWLPGLISVGPLASIVVLNVLRPSIEASPDSLRIQNPFRTYVVRWDEIRSVVPGYRGLQIELSDGSVVNAFAAQKSNWSSWRHRSTRADEIAAELLRRAGLARGADVEAIERTTAEPTPMIEDPGWRPALVALVPIVGVRVAAQRARNHPARGLVVVRQLFLSFAVAIGLFAFVLVQLNLASEDGSISTSTVLFVVGAVAAVAFVPGRLVERPLDCSSESKLMESWRTRFFIRIAFGEASALVGFVGAFLSGATSPYFLGAAATAIMFARAAPSARNIADDQADLYDRGCSLSLLTVIATCQPRREPGRE
ncbi:MAG: PH domain-containing protein [Acidimicrobiales bacterium]